MRCRGTREEKIRLLGECGIALWDVIAQCTIVGSGDASIRDAVPNDIAGLTESGGIRQIFTNGRTAHNLYRKYCEESCGIPAKYLPSTSPLNAATDFGTLFEIWRVNLIGD